MPRFDIHHVTKYTYDGPVRDSASQVLLFPIKDEYQELLRQELTITGDPVLDKYKDYYENEVGSFSNAEPHSSLVIDSNIEVITRPRPLPKDQAPADEQWKYLQQIRWEVQYIDFLKQEHFDRLQELLDNAGLERAGSGTPLEASEQLRNYVFDNFQYIKGVTSVESTLDEVWKLKAGVCQDFAHILLVLLRQIHIPGPVRQRLYLSEPERDAGGRRYPCLDRSLYSYEWMGWVRSYQ